MLGELNWTESLTQYKKEFSAGECSNIRKYRSQCILHMENLIVLSHGPDIKIIEKILLLY